MPPVLLDGRELAGCIDASYDDVMSWARTGRIPSIKTSRRVYFNLERVIEALRRAGDHADATAETVGEASACR